MGLWGTGRWEGPEPRVRFPPQLVHVPSSKTRVAYILSLLRESDRPASVGAVAEKEEEDHEEDEADLTMFDCEVQTALPSPKPLIVCI